MLQDEICRLQRESLRCERVHAEGSSRSSVEKGDRTRLDSCPGILENVDNVQGGLKTSPSDGQNLANSKSSTHGHEGPAAKSSREARYRALYLEVQEDYKKLRDAYLKLKRSYEESQYALREWKKGKVIETAECERVAKNNGATWKGIRYLDESPSPAREASLGLSARSLSDVSKHCSIPLLELPKEGEAPNTSTGIKDVTEETDRHSFAHSPNETGQRLGPTEDKPPFENQSSKSTPKLLGIEDSKAPKDVKPSLGKAVEESDEPILISERSLKRKRPKLTESTRSEIFEGAHNPRGNLTKPVRIKSDHGSSSPLSIAAYHALANPHDSIDLDEVGDKTLTPRKRRRMLAIMGPTSSDALMPLVDAGKGDCFDHEFQGLSNGNLYQHEARPGSLIDFDEPHLQPEWHFRDTTRANEYSKPLWEVTLKRERSQNHNKPADSSDMISYLQKSHSGNRYWLHDRKNLERYAGDGCSDIDPARSDPVRDVVTSSGQTFTTILGPIDHNRQMLPRTSNSITNQHGDLQKQWKNHPTISRTNPDILDRGVSRSAAKIGLLAEDGEKINDVGNENATDGPSISLGHKPIISKNLRSVDSEALGTHQRLDTLLSTLPPQNPPPATPCVARSNATELDTSGGGFNGCSSVTKYGDQSCMKETKSVNQGSPLSSRPLPKSERQPAAQRPLRIRPPSNLCPEDFKLNPQHNQGLNYAYSEVIRNREARKCMNGCTRPGCCGNLLRKAIEIGGYKAPRKSRLSRTTPEDETEEDQQLLNEYLGDVKYRLKDMPENERKELLLKAQTERFANQYGKHRHMYGRGSTPPGFWNTDMPTTQEEMENRRAAQALEREKVEEMYREAMRPNGRYKFRDE